MFVEIKHGEDISLINPLTIEFITFDNATKRTLISTPGHSLEVEGNLLGEFKDYKIFVRPPLDGDTTDKDNSP